MKAEQIDSSEITQRLLTCLHSLQDLAAQHSWRGLLLLQAPSSTTFLWPQGALVLDSELNQYRHHLGTNQAVVVLDLRASLHGDALAACIPTLSSGGLAIVLLPLTLSPFAQRLCANLPTPYARHVILRSSEASDPQQIGQPPNYLPVESPANVAHQPIDLRPLKVPELTQVSVKHADQLNEEQTAILNQLHQQVARGTEAPVLINAPRGRGKSTLLGIFAAQLMDAGHQVTVSAPSRRQLQSLQTSAARPLNFVAPDALLANRDLGDIVILDEAASLPQHMLDALLKRYPRLVMATTSEGYETCGRGFLLRFQQRLRDNFANFLHCTLQKPVRFAAECPVESWLHQVLLLSPHSRPTLPQPTRSTLQYRFTNAAQLTEPQLQACFYLLMDAHYQTSPNDLKLLLDDPNHQLVLQIAQQDNQAHIIGVVWLCTEGQLNSELASAVVAGTRRPAGNLLAQGLAYYFQHSPIARAQWWRITRVAVMPGLQYQGLGTQLIDHVINQAPAELAGIGTSFASTATINRFWRRANFLPVRIGDRKDPVTGCHALMMLYPISPPWIERVQQWAAYWHVESPAAKVIYKLSGEYFSAVQPLPKAADCDYQAWAKERVQSFLDRQLDISSVRLTMATLLAAHLEHDAILRHVVFDRPMPLSLLQKFSLRGRKDAVEYIRGVCFKLVRAI